MVALLNSNTSRNEWVLTACHRAFGDSDATAHMVKNDSMITEKKVPSDAIIETAGRDNIKSKTQGNRR